LRSSDLRSPQSESPSTLFHPWRSEVKESDRSPFFNPLSERGKREVAPFLRVSAGIVPPPAEDTTSLHQELPLSNHKKFRVNQLSPPVHSPVRPTFPPCLFQFLLNMTPKVPSSFSLESTSIWSGMPSFLPGRGKRDFSRKGCPFFPCVCRIRPPACTREGFPLPPIYLL